ncbi:efflux RND transporter periplasmic adaptor subunit [Rhodopila sp.]|uniref:efflux RND transporter periplasmic adaptor subunit n=1 Tax=Rhodopila sp. TaxID=2480087 RepID=UPI003D0D18D8
MIIPGLAGCKRQNSFVVPPAPKVTVATPTAKQITRYLEATGNAAALNSVDLFARIQGTLQAISYTDGSAVKTGDVLFTIEPPPYQTKLQQAQAAEAGARAQLVDAEANYNRQLSLQKNAVASVQSLDDARAQRDNMQASLSQAQANTQLAAITFSYTRVLAPFDGLVSAHLVSVGELVGTQPTQLATIVQIQPIYVTFNISEQDLQGIRVEMARRGLRREDLGRVPLEVGLQTETGFPHAGHLDYAAPTVNPATGTLAVRGVLKNADRALLPGNYVRVRVPLEQNVDALLVPDTALGRDQGGSYVLVVGGDDVVAQRGVSIGPLDGTMRVIEHGLAPADRVVIDGLQRAVPGQKVATDSTARTASADSSPEPSPGASPEPSLGASPGAAR